MLEGAEEVVVHLRHRVLFLLPGKLGAEERLLEQRVVQLGVGVGQLHAPNEELEPLGDRRVGGLPLGQGADRGRVVEDEDGPFEPVLDDLLAIRSKAESLGISAAGKDHDVIVSEVFEELVEDSLTGPVFVIDYPAAICPLTKRKADDPSVAERFELFVHGMELANAYTELNDPILQADLFSRQLAGQKAEDSMATMDDDFVRALKHAMPPAGGLGVGIDRLCMLLLNRASIRDVILFPLLRPE